MSVSLLCFSYFSCFNDRLFSSHNFLVKLLSQNNTPHFEYLRVFDCTTHVKTAKPYIKKLDDRSQKMVYFGVEDGTKAHKLYDLQHKKIHVSRDVVFEEERK